MPETHNFSTLLGIKDLNMQDSNQLNEICRDKLPGYLGITVTHISRTELRAEFEINRHHMAPNGFLHAGAIVSLADTSCGNGCLSNLPEGASGFTTIELKSNHLSTAKEGTITCIAKPVHLGKTTQVWDAVVTHKQTGKKIALFRCTQMILYPA